MATRRSMLLGAALAATLVVPGTGFAAAESPPPAIAVTAKAPSSGSATKVTLVTGDVVTVTTADGKPAVTVTPHTGSAANFRSYAVGKDVYVIPPEAEPMIASGKLDQQLFNVTGLVAQGYDDARSGSIPLIVEYAGAKAKAVAPSVPRGAKVKRSLPSIRGAAVTAAKAQAATFWDSVDDAKPRLSGGIERIWLDGKLHALLDKSVPQIGAPDAWQAGYDGSGVKVAILDTGVDLNHPDLAGKIVASQSFVAGESVQDGHGYGTHVASTVAGSGAASGGKYKGVAPGAELVVGKVLSDGGTGSESDIIAGMDWAAHSGAKVVSMSLGASARPRETDPLANAVDTLTAQTGVLFTIAAGNEGPGATTVGSPGIAASALTVGAVDADDAVTDFSSRGPIADGGLKPEITAPGAGIVAARASGTTMGRPVDDNYTGASGTSMATPHVAGAAAILAQQHPDWTSTRLKSQLISTAKTSADSSVYLQGAGRVDVSRAVGQTVSGSGVVDFGLRPFGAKDPVVKQLIYTNDGDQPVTLSLARKVAGTAVPDGTFQLGADSVTVPAHGTADVSVTLTGGDIATGAYGEHVVATDGSTVVTTAVGFVQDVERFDLTVDVKDRDATAPAESYGTVYVFDLKNPKPADMYFFPGTEGTLKLNLPRGEYAVESMTYRFTHSYEQVRQIVYGAESGVVLDQHRDLTFDGTQAQRVGVRTPKPSQNNQIRMSLSMASQSNAPGYELQSDSPSVTKLWAIPTTGKKELIEHRLHFSNSAPELSTQVVGPGAFPITPEYIDGWAGSTRIDGTEVLQVVNAGTGRPEDFAGTAVRGKVALVKRSDAVPVGQVMTNAADAGAGVVIIYNDTPGEWGATYYSTERTRIPALTLTNEQGVKLARLAKAKLRFEGTATPAYSYEVMKTQVGITADQQYQIDPAELATVDTSFHASTPIQGGYGRALISDKQTFLMMSRKPTLMPRRLTEYVSAGLRTNQLVTASTDWVLYGGGEQSLMAVLQPGERTTRSWNNAVVRSAITPNHPDGAVRVDNVGATDISPMIGNGTGQWVTLFSGLNKTVTTVYRDGQLLGSAPSSTVAFPMVPEQATYKVVLDVTKDQPWWTTSTKVSTAWTFASAHSERSTLPVLSVDYALDVALDNSAQAGRPLTVGLGFRYPKGLAGPQLRQVDLEASYDDGATWQRVPVSKTGAATANGVLRTPSLRDTNGFVTLRVRATDADGTAVEQTVDRAYRLR